MTMEPTVDFDRRRTEASIADFASDDVGAALEGTACLIKACSLSLAGQQG
jgi:hypothetical protein